MKGLVALPLVFVGAGCLSFGAAPPPAPPRTTHLGLQLQQLELANGLRVVVVEDASASELAVTMRYQVGAVDDPAGQAGIAHLVEHLMYQQVLGADTLFSHLENATTYFNGETTADATTYMARANPEHLDELLSIEAVRVGLRCTSLNDSAFERERAVVLNELRQHDGGSDVRAALMQGAYPEGHPYRVAVGGSEASVGAITRAQACAFADAHYGPTNAVLVVSGKVTVALVEASLKKFMTHVAKHPVVAPIAIAAAATTATAVTVAAPIDHDAVLVTWPLPLDPLARVRIHALATAVASLVDREIRGSVQLVELGGARAPVIGLVGVPGEGETSEQLVAAIGKGGPGVNAAFRAHGVIELGELAFDRVQQAAIYRLFSSLDDGIDGNDGDDRDARLAADVFAGRDPSASIAAEFQGLRELGRSDAAALAEHYFDLHDARIATLVATGSHAVKAEQLASAPIHDLGLHRDPPDPELALSPLTGQAVPPELPRTQHTFTNGMRVVLLPTTSVPTVEARLVFGSGTGDEPSDQRGTALLAARTLTWNYRYLNDLLLFAASGGEVAAEVDLDHTSFVVRGLDMHLDLLLTGLRQLVRNGLYSRNPANIATAIRFASKTENANGELTDAWRAAIYGADHPYVFAGNVRHLSNYLTLESLARFRQANFTPANATLVIAGHFDAALAQRWIDFLFADWEGPPLAPRPTGKAHPQPASLATYTDAASAQLQLSLALPATAGSRAEQLIAAEMLATVANEIRHQLGASYGFSSRLQRERLASDYRLTGAVESARAADAFALLAARLGELRSDANAAARAFVLARAHVVTHLRSTAGGASALARKVELDISLGLPALSDLETATAAAAVTVDQEMSALGDLDLAHAVISLRGSEAAVTAAFTALGRTGTVITHHPLAAIPRAAPSVSAVEQDVKLDEIEPALSEQRTRDPLTFGAEAGFATGSVADIDISGFSVAGQVGYRFDDNTTAGLYLGLGRVSGSYQIDPTFPVHQVSTVPLDLAGYARATAYDRLFALVFLGLHVNFASDNTFSTTDTGIGAGLGVGIDLWTTTRDRLAIYAAVQGELLTDIGYVAGTFGLGYHR